MNVHPQLLKDTVKIGDLQLCELRLVNDQRFDWLMLVPQRENVIEWFDLADSDQVQLHQETMWVAKKLKLISHADKINIGALGNIVRQLHVHIIARREGDACWPKSVWGTAMEPMSDATLDDRVARYRQLLAT